MRRLFVVLLLGCSAAPGVEELASVPTISEARVSGDRVAFVSDESGSPEAWILSDGAARRLTHLKENVSHLRFSPDGKWLYAVCDSGGNERYDLLRIPTSGGEPTFLTRTDRSETEPEPSPDGKWLAFTRDSDVDFQPQLHVVDLETGLVRRLTNLTPPVYGPVWSRDSTRIAVFQSKDEQSGDLLIVEIETGRFTRVPPPVAGGAIRPAAFAPDGRLLACASNPKGFLQLALVGPEVRFLGPDDWDVEQATWTERGIFFVRNEGGSGALYRMSGPDAVPERLYASAGVLESLDGDVFLEQDVARPPHVRRIDRALTSSKCRARARGGMIRYASFDGTTIHALFVPPVSGTARPPLVVWAHGGPGGQARPRFDACVQSLAEAGFAVLRPNFRGSTGYGKAFEDANNKDWGGADLRDVVEGVRHLAAKGAIDPDRVGIMGGSFGGYLTLMALARTPEVWKAGVASYGMPDLVLDYELSKDQFGTWYETEMGTPSTHPDLFRDRSPITHLDRIRAPLLVFQGANDTNVPKAESELLVSELRKRGRPVEYVLYADEGHGFVRRKNRIDEIRRTVAFFRRHLLAPP